MKIRLHPYRHCGGFLFGGSKAKTTSIDARTAASEGSIAVGQQGKYIESGGLDIAGSEGAKLGTTELTAGGDVTVTTSDPELLSAALAAYRDISSKALESQRDVSIGSTREFSSFAKASHEQQAQDLATLLTALGQLETETDEGSQEKRTVLYLVLALLALLALIFYRRP